MGSTVSGKNAESYLFNWVVYVSVPQSMCYSHYGNGVGNGAISTAQWGLLSNGYKLNPYDVPPGIPEVSKNYNFFFTNKTVLALKFSQNLGNLKTRQN